MFGDIIESLFLPRRATLLALGFALIQSTLKARVLVQAQTIQEALWNVPSGSAADLVQTFQTGNTIPVSWNAYNSSIDDLWVTTWDYNLNPYEQLLKENIDLNQGGIYSWTIDIPSSQLVKSAKYCLRFKPPNGGTYNEDDTELSSPGFLIIQAAESSSSTTTTSSSHTSAAESPTETSDSSDSGSADSATNTDPADSGANNSTDDSSGGGELSGGAKAGIGIGCTLAVLVLVAIPAWLWWKRRRQQQQEGSAADPMMASIHGGPPPAGGYYAPSEIAGKAIDTPPVASYSPQLPQELPAPSPVEMYAGPGR